MSPLGRYLLERCTILPGGGMFWPMREGHLDNDRFNYWWEIVLQSGWR